VISSNSSAVEYRKTMVVMCKQFIFSNCCRNNVSQG